MPTARRLIVHASNFDIGVMAIEERADRPMTNREYVAVLSSTERGLRFANDTFLGVLWCDALHKRPLMS